MFAAARSCALRHATVSSSSTRATLLQQPYSLRRLVSSLAVLEHKDGKLNVSSLAAVTAAMKLGGPIAGFIAGSGAKAVAEEAAKVKGLDKVIYVDSDAYSKV